MADWSTGSVATYCFDRIDDIPSSISGTPMERIAETIINDLENYTGETIGTTAIPNKYHNILVNLTCAYTLGRMAGIGVDFNFSLGEFSVNPAAGTGRTEFQHIQFFTQQANASLRTVGKNLLFGKAFG